ncbi:MAG: 16S rRNA (cytosine(967)-C(5))-methyltransferase RsmB [Bacteroidota bacterium]
MKKSSLIGHTVEVYDLINRSEHPADSTIDTFFRSHKYLGSHDRRFIAETVYGMLRHKKRIEWLSETSGKKFLTLPENQATFLQCLVYRATVAGDEVETLAKELEADSVEEQSLMLILNEAKERNDRLEGESGPHGSDAAHLSLVYSFPEWMIKEWHNAYGEDETVRMCVAFNTSAPLTLRVNTLKAGVEDCQAALSKENIDTERTKFSQTGLTVRRKINIFNLDAFRKGFFEVQDEGSQILALLVDPKPTSKVVDACAGGGGKSLALAALMKNRGVIFALDTNSYRLEGLRKRIRRSGVDTIRICKVDEGELPPALVDAADNVLVDAPCSGLGTLRRNPGMKWTVTPQSIEELKNKQSKILDHYSRCVKIHGRLIYSTCTMMKSENEEVVEKFLDAHPQFEIMQPSVILSRYQLESLSEGKYFRLKPHIHGTDGFFAAVMRRSR